METLPTVEDVIKVLGGQAQVVRLLGYSSHTYIAECASKGHFPSNTHAALQRALRVAGERDGKTYVAPASLWQQRPLVEEPEPKRRRRA